MPDWGRKILEVGLALARSPSDLLPYASQFLHGMPTALEQGVPWIPYPAIRFLEGHLRDDHDVLELGGGGSTMFFGERVGRVITIESDLGWASRIRRELEIRNLVNVEIRYGSAGDSSDRLIDSDFVRCLPDECFDLIMIDSADHWDFERRPILFDLVRPRLKRQGIILLDDSWRYPQVRAQNAGVPVQTFRGLGPARRAVSSADVFFFQHRIGTGDSPA